MAALDSGYAEAISFSRDYISTPDLAQRLETGDGVDTDYIDFPSLPRQ